MNLPTCRSCKNSYCRISGWSAGVYCRMFKFELISPNKIQSQAYNQEQDTVLAELAKTCKKFEPSSTLTVWKMMKNLERRNIELLKEFGYVNE